MVDQDQIQACDNQPVAVSIYRWYLPATMLQRLFVGQLHAGAKLPVDDLDNINLDSGAGFEATVAYAFILTPHLAESLARRECWRDNGYTGKEPLTQ